MAPKRPILSNYPHLHSVLKNDSRANVEFNAAILEMTRFNARGNTVDAELVERLETSESNLQEYIEKYNEMEKLTEATVRFIRLLGENIEVQTQLTPYVEDLAKDKDYSIHFTAVQIRLALHLHWDVIGASMENAIGRSLITDPAAERANK